MVERHACRDRSGYPVGGVDQPVERRGLKVEPDRAGFDERIESAAIADVEGNPAQPRHIAA